MKNLKRFVKDKVSFYLAIGVAFGYSIGRWQSFWVQLIAFVIIIVVAEALARWAK